MGQLFLFFFGFSSSYLMYSVADKWMDGWTGEITKKENFTSGSNHLISTHLALGSRHVGELYP